ncbi:MAG: hypothetical protein DCF32_10400 [Leptolyngbya sp.]|nr:MAG: hypothetical protein DCF32_10400 [Leptolyngbya sp.]
MANANAVSAACEAVTFILQTALAPLSNEIAGSSESLRFEVYRSSDFADQDAPNRVTSGASIFLYRVVPNLSCRNPVGNALSNGSRLKNKLSLDLNILITVWGQDSSTQNRLVGWVMHILEHHTTLPAAVLNSQAFPNAFGENETVDLILGEINSEELLQLWEALGHGELPYQISIPYLLRSVVIDSPWVLDDGPPVQSRTLDMQRVVGG